MTATDRSFAVGDWLVEPSINRISTASEEIHLRPQLMEVLVYLADQQGRIATLESIHDDLWSGRVVSSGTIYNCIAELREAFARNGKQLSYIETVPKKGYRLAPPIVAMPASEGNSRTENSIAILPLVNRRNDPDIEYLCDGIPDEILYGLSKVSGLNVFSAMSLKDQNLDVRVVGHRFGAQMVLSGSLQESAQTLRVIFRLDDVSTGETLWSGRYDEQLNDILEFQDTVARQVINAISPTLDAGSDYEPILENAGTRNLEAFNAFLLGKHALSRSSIESYDAAISYFEQAVALDPSFARAHYRLYLASYWKRRQFGSGQEMLDKARIAAENAKNNGYQPAVPWVHIQRRLYRETRLSSREMGLEAIDKIRERDVEWASFGYEQLTWILSAAGFFRATLDFAKRMLDSPASTFDDSDAEEEVPIYYSAVGETEKAIRLCSALIRKAPTRPYLRVERSILHARLEQYDYAQEDLEVLVEGWSAYLGRACYHFWRGEADIVRENHERLLAIPNNHPAYLLLSYSMIGDIDAAMVNYEESVDSTSRSFVDFGWIRATTRARLPMSVVDQLEQHPVFEALLKKEGIDDAWREELAERLNDMADITGIQVKEDDVIGSLTTRNSPSSTP
jgi:TolB-like protein